MWQSFNLLKESGVFDLKTLFRRCRNQRYLIFSIDSDVCFYPDAQEEMARELKEAGVTCMRITVHSEKGHDSFTRTGIVYASPSVFVEGIIKSLFVYWPRRVSPVIFFIYPTNNDAFTIPV
jgi:homoserine O-acetyltransferase